MGHLILDDIITAAGGEVLQTGASEFMGLSIDSRTIREGDFFIALKGPHFDGHAFLDEALQRGSGALVSVPPADTVMGKTIVRVADTLRALQEIGRHLRKKRDIPVVGITGTNGKTTTKEMIATVLEERHKVLKTQGNLNNHIGLPLSIARMEGDETAMVLEMGSNAEGDIALLCDIAEPGFGVVTNVGPAHLEGFGSLEVVRRTDLEIMDHVKVLSVNADDSFLMEGVKGYRGKLITYGLTGKADVFADGISHGERGSSFLMHLPSGPVRVTLAVPGEFNILNALAAASLAFEFGMDPELIKKGLESFSGVPMRLEIREFMGALILNDVYNANPASTEEALKELSRLKKRRAIAVLGDMLELGPFAEDEHRKIVRRMNTLNIEVFIAVGTEMKKASSEFSGTCYVAADSSEARSLLLGILSEQDTVLVKGSRGMRMEQVIAERKPASKENSYAL